MGQFPSSSENRKFHEDYKLKSFLGSGSFGVVWEMEGEIQNWALKIILVDPQNEEKQKRELDISLKVKHDNLVEVFAVERKETKSTDLSTLVPVEDINCASIVFQLRREETFEVFCITLELCGETLRKWLKEEHDSTSFTTNFKQFKIVVNILEGLKYLHSKRIIHRDLKPENILFSCKGYVLPAKIGDYGACRVLKDTQSSTLTSNVGTDLYRAPELSSNNYNLQSDLFSLGLITWEVLQLIPLQNLRNHFDRLVNDREVGVVQLSPRFENFRDPILKLCDKNAQNRLNSLDQIKVKEFVAANSEELKVILQNCEDGWTIRLVDGVYEGDFLVDKKGVTLIGQSKEKTILTPLPGSFLSAHSVRTALTIGGADFKTLNLKVDGAGRKLGSGISIQADNCSLEGIIVSNFPGYWMAITSRNSLNTKINNVSFEDVDFPIWVNGGNCSIRDVIINKCLNGLAIYNVDNSLIHSVSIAKAEHLGITISASKKIQLENVQIVSYKNPTVAGYSYPPYGIGILRSPEGNFELRNVTCSGFGRKAGLFISRKSFSASLKVVDSRFGKVIKDAQGKYCE